MQLLKLVGARHVTVLEIVEQKRRLAARLGADLVLDPVAEGEGLKERIAGSTAALGPDLAVECAGKAQSLGLCIDLVRTGGPGAQPRRRRRTAAHRPGHARGAGSRISSPAWRTAPTRPGSPWITWLAAASRPMVCSRM